jgi:hypothetical protein
MKKKINKKNKEKKKAIKNISAKDMTTELLFILYMNKTT